jgi:gamma-glutamyltranspeptidase / glutathione hydrolase
MNVRTSLTSLALLALILLPAPAFPQATPPLSVCTGATPVPACEAERGDRADGWRAQTRAEVMAPHAMVVASQPLAAQAGLQTILRGGNAIDAAVATAAVLNLVEPMMTGVAGDLFAVIYVAKEKKLYVLNASGTAPSGATVERFASLGYRASRANWGPGSGMPFSGILPVTVPGAAWGWEEVLNRFGRLTFNEVLQPAIDYAENGFPVSQQIASGWVLPPALPPTPCCGSLDPDSVATWYIEGRPPVAGQIFRNSDLAKTFRLLQQQGRDAFYKGEIARSAAQ